MNATDVRTEIGSRFDAPAQPTRPRRMSGLP